MWKDSDSDEPAMGTMTRSRTTTMPMMVAAATGTVAETAAVEATGATSCRKGGGWISFRVSV